MVAAVFSVVEKKDPVTTPLLFAYAALVLSKVSALSTGADTLVAVLQVRCRGLPFCFPFSKFFCSRRAATSRSCWMSAASDLQAVPRVTCWSCLFPGGTSSRLLPISVPLTQSALQDPPSLPRPRLTHCLCLLQVGFKPARRVEC